MSTDSMLDDDPFGELSLPDPSPSVPASSPVEPTIVTLSPALPHQRTPVEPEPESAENELPDGSVRSVTASSGRRQIIPPPNELPDWADTASQDAGDIQEDATVDYQDLNEVSRELTRLRIRMHRIRREQRRVQREAVEAKLVYQRQLRRALVQQSGGSAEMRKASAELLCEDLEADMVMKAQVADEYNSLFRTVRDDIDNVKTISYNVRTLMSIV